MFSELVSIEIMAVGSSIDISLQDDLLVPIAHTNQVRVQFQAETLVHDSQSVSYRAAVGPYCNRDSPIQTNWYKRTKF